VVKEVQVCQLVRRARVAVIVKPLAGDDIAARGQEYFCQ